MIYCQIAAKSSSAQSRDFRGNLGLLYGNKILWNTFLNNWNSVDIHQFANAFGQMTKKIVKVSLAETLHNFDSLVTWKSS